MDVHMLWSLLHDSVISDLSPSRSVSVVQTQMSYPSLVCVYVWLRQRASTSESVKPTHAYTHKITSASSREHIENIMGLLPAI